MLYYIKASFKTFKSNRWVSFINLAGLATGLSICLLMILYVRFETGYDAYNKNGANIYRLVTDVKSGNTIDYRTASAPMGPALQAAFPEIKAQTRLFLDNLLIKKDDKIFCDEEIAYADSSLFTIFTLPLISGNPQTVFAQPFNMVLSETAAKKYFGNENPVGKTLTVDGRQTALITGVMKDMPANSHLRVDILFSMPTLLQVFNPSRATDWKKFGCNTYLLLQPGYNINNLNAKLPAFVHKNMGESTEHYSLLLEPLLSVYLHGKARGWRTGSIVTGSTTNVYIFIFTAALVLLIACINFTNLSIAISLKYAKNVAVHKVLGAGKIQLVIQFLFHAVLLSLLAAFAALLLCTLLLPAFNNLAGKVIATSVLQSPACIGLLIIIAVITGLAAGIYPAIYLSSFNPITYLKGSYAAGTKSSLLRKALVTVQFSFAVILVVATLVVLRQVKYMQSEKLGFKKGHLLVIDFHFDGRILDAHETVKQQLLRVPGVTGASFSSCIPGKANVKMFTSISNSNGTAQLADVDTYSADQTFLQQYQINIIAGRNFSSFIQSDTDHALLLNETAVKALGYTDPKQVIGKRFLQGGFNNAYEYTGTVVGVVKDFHYHSLKDEIEPLTINMYRWRYTYLNLTLAGADINETIGRLQKQWATIAPVLPMSYSFADETFNAQYLAEQHFGMLFKYFSAVAIILSCLGLFGLCTFSTTQRRKETGIRKVLGATTFNIAAILSKDFLQPVCLAILMACPIAWLTMQQWLQHYAYHIVIGWQVFAMAAFAAVAVSVITIGYHTLKAALVNPAESLKTN